MAETFKPGDIVEIKSGGPRMTVSTVENNTVWCTWYDTYTHAIHRDVNFSAEVLKVYKSTPISLG